MKDKHKYYFHQRQNKDGSFTLGCFQRVVVFTMGRGNSASCRQCGKRITSGTQYILGHSGRRHCMLPGEKPEKSRNYHTCSFDCFAMYVKEHHPEYVNSQYRQIDETLVEFDTAKHRTKQTGDFRKRAKVLGESIDNRQIIERDECKCHICNLPIDTSKQFPYPTSPCTDHVVTLSLGGRHTESNVKAAHVLCNSVKAARMTMSVHEVDRLRVRIQRTLDVDARKAERTA